MEVGNESQSSFHVFVKGLEGQVFEISHGIWSLAQRSFENTHLELELFILLFELLDSLFWWNLSLGSSSHLNCTLSLDKSSDEVGHFTFFYLTISIFIELFEKAIELVYGNSRLSLKLHKLVQKVEGL